jgi:hypothetical protein
MVDDSGAGELVMAENIPKWLEATKNLGVKTTRAALPATMAAGATKVFGGTDAEVGSAGVNTWLAQGMFNAGSAVNRWRARAGANRTLSGAQDNLKLRLRQKDAELSAALKALPRPPNTVESRALTNSYYDALARRDAEVAQAREQVNAGQKGVESILAEQAANRGPVANRNAVLGGVAGVGSVPALNMAQAALTNKPEDPNAPAPESWGGATGRTVADAGAIAASNVLGKPTPDEGLPWDKIAIGGGAAALLAALLYKITRGNQSRDDNDEDED